MNVILWFKNLFRRKSMGPREKELALVKGVYLTATTRRQFTREVNCQHKKGGIIHSPKDVGRTLEEGGSGYQYAVIKHMMSNGDIWVRCMRCGKWWKPPVRAQYKNDIEWYFAIKEYEDAKKFPTNNGMSSSIQYTFHNDTTGEKFRSAMVNS